MREDYHVIMDGVTIRGAVINDSQKIADLLRSLGYPNTPIFVKSKVTRLSKSNSDTIIVSEVKGEVVGVAHLHIAELFHQPGRLGRVMALVVDAEYRRQGIGQKIMGFLERIAKDAGCIKMEVTSGIHRDDAHAFYNSLGYTEKRRRFVKVLE